MVADLPTTALHDHVWDRSGHTRKGRDGCRVPLPWDGTAPAYGFSSAQPWLPQPSCFAAPAASAQVGDADSTLELYRSALALRRSLQSGERLSWVLDTEPDLVAFDRHDRWRSTTNFGEVATPLPAGEILLASGPITDGTLPPATTIWTAPLRSTSETDPRP